MLADIFRRAVAVGADRLAVERRSVIGHGCYMAFSRARRKGGGGGARCAGTPRAPGNIALRAGGD